jgi:hypothetical protein
MRPEVIGQLVNGAIPFFGGIYVILLGFRVVGKKPGASLRYDEWHNRFGGTLKVCGPVIVLFGLFLWITGIARVSSASGTITTATWQRYTTSDGVCSAEFPEPPKQGTQTAFGVESDNLTLSRESGAVSYIMAFSNLPAEAPEATVEQRLDAFRDNMPAAGAQMRMKYEFVREERITQNEVGGREIEFAAAERYVVRTKIFIIGRRIYRIIATVPRTRRDAEDTQRFLGSLRLENGKK